jgi:DNA-binding transcriptional regulator YhcF (GntR family)
MEFRLDRDLPVPLGTQLRGLIEYGIGFGELTPGERLPSVREMAEQLRVAPMTVAQVYRELKDQGLLQSRLGAGTFVADAGKPLPRTGADMTELHRSIDRLIDDGLAMGLRASDLAGLVGARMAERLASGTRKHIALVGNFEAATSAYAYAIGEILGSHVTVEALTIDAISQQPTAHQRAAAADLVLTFAHRRHEVVKLLPGSVVAAISFIPSEATRRSLASLDPLAQVAVVSIFPEFTPLMKTAVQRFAPHVPSISVTLINAPDLDSLLRRCDVLVYATGAEDLVDRLPAGTQAFEYRHTPDPADVRRVVAPLISPSDVTAGSLDAAS